MPVEFIDNSIKIKAAINKAAIAALYEAAGEVESHAKRHCKMDGEIGTQLKGSYSSVVNENAGTAQIGSPLEVACWEEFGTGEHAENGDGRKGWWVYVEGGSGYKGATNSYASEQEAVEMAAFIRAVYKVPAVATNGRKPAATLRNAFDANKNKIIKHFEELLGGVGGE